MSNTFTTKVSGRMSSRGWAIALGIGAIVLAAILLVVYLDRYRARVGGENAPTPVLVAKQLIPGGRRARSSRASRCTRPPRFRARRSRSARSPIRRTSPGAQRPSTSSRPAVHGSRLRRERHGPSTRRSPGPARDLDLDGQRPRGLSQVQTGDFVDIYTGVAGVVKLFKPNVKVLAVPSVPGPSGGGNLGLRIESKDAANFAYAADNTQLYFVLRPVVGAKPTKPSTANAATVLR